MEKYSKIVCKLCNHSLRNEISRAIGYSKSCAKKVGIHYPTKKEYFLSLSTSSLLSQSLDSIQKNIQFRFISPQNIHLTANQCIQLSAFCIKTAYNLGYKVEYVNDLDAFGTCYNNKNLIKIRYRNHKNWHSLELVTLLHELVHASGDRHNLNRQSLIYYGNMRLEEELIAEFTAYRILHKLGMIREGDMINVTKYMLILYKKYNRELKISTGIFYFLERNIEKIMNYLF